MPHFVDEEQSRKRMSNVSEDTELGSSRTWNLSLDFKELAFSLYLTLEVSMCLGGWCLLTTGEKLQMTRLVGEDALDDFRMCLYNKSTLLN